MGCRVTRITRQTYTNIHISEIIVITDSYHQITRLFISLIYRTLKGFLTFTRRIPHAVFLAVFVHLLIAAIYFYRINLLGIEVDFYIKKGLFQIYTCHLFQWCKRRLDRLSSDRHNLSLLSVFCRCRNDIFLLFFTLEVIERTDGLPIAISQEPARTTEKRVYTIGKTLYIDG